MDQWVMQLPSVAQALQSATDPANAQKTLKDAVGEQGDKVSPVITLASIVQKQFEKSAGGFLKSIGRLFKTGSLTTADQALKFVGLTSQGAAEDVLNVPISKYAGLTQAGQNVPTVQVNTQANSTPESGSTQSSASNQSQAAQSSSQSQEGTPTTGTNASTGNAQAAQKPTAEEMQTRDRALQGVVKNRNAFNTQLIGGMSNDEVRADLLKIAQSLGINLK
jgi:hypothetical protein